MIRDKVQSFQLSTNMYTLLKPLKVREELLKRGLRIFTSEEFRRIFQTHSNAAKYFLETQVKTEFLMRLKRKIYILKTDPPVEEEIANALYKPSYISFEYALSYYHLLPEMSYTITSATTKPTRLFTILEKPFSYRTIKEEVFTGYSLMRLENKSFLIAEKEKALVDYLYFVILKKSPQNERLFRNLRDKRFYKTQGLDKEKITLYAKLFESKHFLSFVDSFL